MERKLIYLLYRLAQACAFPFILLYLLRRGVLDRRYFHSLPQRLGLLPHSFDGTVPGSIWLHAVSVGEVISSVRLLERLRARYPRAPMFVSSTTMAGKMLADEKLRGLADGVFYAPMDYRFAVRGVLRRLRPSLVIVLETEIWPNLYREVKRAGAGLLVVNGRISDRTFPRYRRLRWLFRHVLAWPDAVLAQSEVSAGRYRELGAPPERVRAAGNLKYDFEPARTAAPDAVRELLDRLQPSGVWIAASTMPPRGAGDVDEDDTVLESFQRVAENHPRLLLMLVPRRPERFEVVARKLEVAGIPFVKRSELHPGADLSLPGVLLVDSIGELSTLFPLADVVFMGGSLAQRGGHNILEPAFFARSIIVGPHMENFPTIAEEFRAERAVEEIADASELAPAVGKLLEDSSLRAETGARARRLALAERGATDTVLREIRRLYPLALPREPVPALLFCLLCPLAKLWSAGANWKRSRSVARRRTLETPVISVGGIAMGGTGKTPFVLYLARRLSSMGYSPAILTRGYRRRSPERHIILEAGAAAPAALTGDEAALFLRSGLAPVGIGADRYETGTLLENRFHPGVILLDDGFQHWRLNRQIDIVLVDALDPFAGGCVFPLGRLREPLEALERADAILITRAEAGGRLDAIQERLRALNPRAPILRSRVVPRCWVDAQTSAESPAASLHGSRLAAFCGLANPGSFWHTLAGLGYHPAFRWAFPDHHHYRPTQLLRLASQAKAVGADSLLTTEKDLMNLPGGFENLLAPLRLFWLKIEMAVEGEFALTDLIRQSVRAPIIPRGRAAFRF